MQARKFQINTADGRRLDVVDCGEVGNPAVVVHHGTPGARGLFGGWVDDAERKGIRLIGYSRPGYGASTRSPGRPVRDAADDVAAIAEKLNLTRLATWGYSGGGPHALSCAARLPELVVAASTIASVAPYGAEGLDFLAGMGEGNVEEFESILAGEAVTRPPHEAAVAAMPSTVEAVIEDMASVLSPPDRAAMREHLGEWMITLFGEAFSHGADGWIDDDLAFVEPWGFELSEIRVPLQLWQGQHDLMVPLGHGEWLAAHLPRAEWYYLPDSGHLTLLVDQVPQIHQWLLERF
ncbi:MAG TPA: alpha/beta fold hydrolase [Candidatus Dormibacteraeota bacterium]|nr:alpha/beta fold hydrolase [Candidatus Dormibacteraeota bacterium]